MLSHTYIFTMSFHTVLISTKFAIQEDLCLHCHALELNLKRCSFRTTFINTLTAAPDFYILEISTTSMHLFIELLFVFPTIYRTFVIPTLSFFLSLRNLTGIIANNYLQKNVR
uniref:Uncharacterized protein n=1 Tax=Octopus bimaculoides TaxID=37653 RepID=A0A0L8GXG1_OCTBM